MKICMMKQPVFSLSQVICGAELALLFAETLEKGKVSYDDETLGAVLFYLLKLKFLIVIYFLFLWAMHHKCLSPLISF